VTLALVITVIVVALAFDFTNGFHDASNAIATSVATRALTPRIALLLAALMNFIGAFLGQKVAGTVSSLIGHAPSAGPLEIRHEFLAVILAGLIGAIGWNMITWFFGLPSSSTHALISGIAVAGWAAGVTVQWQVIWDKVVLPMLVSPVVGFIGAFALMILIMHLFAKRNAGSVNRGFRVAQTFTAATTALGHGLQDGQKTMGVIVLALVAGNYFGPEGNTVGIPWWVVVVAATAISLGTWVGGWRIIRTLGQRLADIDPPRGFAAEAVASSMLYASAYLLAAPISTTHVITTSVMGASATRRFSAVRWPVAGRIALAWALTIPGAGLIGAGAYELLRFFGL
jgi:inorganic phosphate transporter, PiT family